MFSTTVKTSTHEPAMPISLESNFEQGQAAQPNDAIKVSWQVALKQGDVATAERLLQANPDLLHEKDEEGYEPLHVAARFGKNPALIDLLIEHKAEVNSVGPNGITPLLLAVEAGDLLTVKCLVENHQANLEAKSTNGYNALYLAYKANSPLLMGYLYKHGLTRGGVGLHPCSPLLVAAASGDLVEVERLLSEPTTDIQVRNIDNDTALHLAASFGKNVELVRLLIAKGISVETVGFNDRTPLMDAVLRDDVKMVQVLREEFNANVNVKGNDGWSIIHIAIHKGQPEITDLVLKAAIIDANQTNGRGDSLLFVAAEKGYMQFVDRLLKAGADVNQAENGGWTPLHIAVHNGHTAIVELLLKAGAEVNQANKNGSSPLYIAAQNGHTATVELLLKAGAEVNQANHNGLNPLYIAIHNGHTAMVELLLKAGAEVNQANHNSLSPLYIAAQNGYTAMVELLIKGGAEVNQIEEDDWSPLLIAAQNGHTATIELLLKARAEVNQANKNGSSPLYMAAQQDHTATVELLLKARAEVNQANKNGSSPLYIAAQNGHTATVELLLKTSAEANQVEKDGWAPLHIAAQNGHTATVELLLKAGAEANQVEKDGWAPLHIAAQNGHTATVELLLKAGAEVNQATKDGLSPLYIVAQNGRTATVELLLKAGAKVNQANKDDWIPLHTAARNGHTAIVELLLKAGAKVNQPNENGASPLYIAAQQDYTATVELLLKAGAEVNQAKKDGWVPLHIAAENGHTATVELLLRAGAKVNQADKDDWAPLHTAARNGHTATVELLLKAGAKVNQANENGASPLYIAAQEGHTATVELLLKVGAKANQANKDGWAPLNIAAQNGHMATAKLLLKAGAEINQANNDGASPLYIAAQNGHTAMVELLLKAGAGVNQAYKDGWTPLHSAARNDYTVTVELLLKAGAEVNQAANDGASPLYVAVRKGHTATAELLVKAGAEVNRANKDGWIPLHSAARNGHTATVELLLKAGAEVNQAANDGSSPLYIAAQNGHTATVELLVKAGAKINQAKKDGWNPLNSAARNGHTATVELLLKAGAEINQINKDGWTPLHSAARNGHTAIIELLLKAGAEINQASNDGSSPLYIAAPHAHTATVELLLKAGAEVNQVSKGSWAPLHMAAWNGHTATIELLLKAGAEVNQANKNGSSPLYIAAQNGQTAAVELLFKAGAEVNWVEEDGWSPLLIAAQNDHTAIVERLLKAGAEVNKVNSKNGTSPIYIAAQNGHTATVELLLKAGAKVNQANPNGVSPLHIAAHAGHTQTAELLLNARADVNQANKDDVKPIESACFIGHLAMVQILIAHKASLERPTSTGGSLLHTVVDAQEREILSLLLDAKADVQAKNKEGQTALDMAAQKHEAALFGLLLSAWFSEKSIPQPFEIKEESLALPSSTSAILPYSGYVPLQAQKSAVPYGAYNKRFIAETAETEEKAIALDDVTTWPMAFRAVIQAKTGKQLIPLALTQGELQQARVLGHGAFGQVLQFSLHTKAVALKQIDIVSLQRWLKVDTVDVLAVLQWEISQLSKVQHPHVVELLGLQSQPNPILAMELCDGTLDKVLSHLTDYERWCMAWEVATGLAYLHDAGLVHRDIKLENILVKNGMAKIGDMGLAKVDPMLADTQVLEPEHLQQLIGDLAWASPEELAVFLKKPQQAQDIPAFLHAIERTTTSACDIYRYGLVLGCLYTQNPHPNAQAHHALASFHAQIIAACLAKTPSQRPSALQLVGALEQNIPHRHPLVAKLTQRLGILAHHHEHALDKRLTPYATSAAIEDIEDYWLNYQEGITGEEKSEQAPRPLPDALAAFLQNSDSQTLVLSAVGGMGKSLAAFAFIRQQWQALRQWLKSSAETSPWIPLFMNATMLQQHSFTTILRGYYQLTAEECDRLAHYPVIFIIDGLDELAQIPTLELAQWSKAKVWFNSRTLPKLETSYQTLYLLPFNQLQIADYLRQQLHWSTGEAQGFLKRLPLAPIRNVLRNPFILSMFETLLETLSKEEWESLSQYAIYQRYIEQWLSRQTQHYLEDTYQAIFAPVLHTLQGTHATLTESFIAFAGWVAKSLFEQSQLQGAIDALVPQAIAPWVERATLVTDEADKHYAEKVRVLDEQGKQTRLSRERYRAFALAHLERELKAPPLHFNHGHYLFMHKSLFEQLWVSALLQAAALPREEAIEHLLLQLPKRSLREEPAVLQLFAKRWQEAPIGLRLTRREHCFALIESTRQFPERAQIAGNLLTLLNAAREMLIHNFSRTHIENADLSFGLLAYSDWRGATLTHINSGNACLRGADFRNVIANKFQFADASSNANFALLGHHDAVFAMVMNGNNILTADKQGHVRLWDKYGKLALSLNEARNITSVALHDNGQFLLGDEKGAVTLHAANGRRIRTFATFTSSILALAFQPGHFLVAEKVGSNALYELATQQQVKNWFTLSANCTQFHVATGKQVNGDKDFFRLADISGPQIKNIAFEEAPHDENIRCLAFSPPGQWIAIAGNDDVALRNGQTGEREATVNINSKVNALTFSSDERYLLLACEDNTLRVLELSSEELIWQFRWSSPVCALSFMSEQELLMADAHGNVHFWHIDWQQKQARLLWLRMGAGYQLDTTESIGIDELVKHQTELEQEPLEAAFQEKVLESANDLVVPPENNASKEEEPELSQEATESIQGNVASLLQRHGVFSTSANSEDEKIAPKKNATDSATVDNDSLTSNEPNRSCCSIL